MQTLEPSISMPLLEILLETPNQRGAQERFHNLPR